MSASLSISNPFNISDLVLIRGGIMRMVLWLAATSNKPLDWAFMMTDLGSL